MVLLRDLLKKFNTDIDIQKMNEELLNCGYDNELTSDEFTYKKSEEDGRKKHEFKTEGVTLTLRELPFNLVIDITYDNGMGDYIVFDEKGDVITQS